MLAVAVLFAVFLLMIMQVRGIKKENDVIENARTGEGTDYDADKDMNSAVGQMILFVVLIILAAFFGLGGALGGGL
jgi:hypothetical protein